MKSVGLRTAPPRSKVFDREQRPKVLKDALLLFFFFLLMLAWNQGQKCVREQKMFLLAEIKFMYPLPAIAEIEVMLM